MLQVLTSQKEMLNDCSSLQKSPLQYLRRLRKREINIEEDERRIQK